MMLCAVFHVRSEASSKAGFDIYKETEKIAKHIMLQYGKYVLWTTIVKIFVFAEFMG
jgi:putative IMPACT (imprinted ancient) family translation regulator